MNARLPGVCIYLLTTAAPQYIQVEYTHSLPAVTKVAYSLQEGVGE
jgi:hypothetical protein